MNGVSKITSEQDIMMITVSDANARTALCSALEELAHDGVVVDMICQSAPRGERIDFSFTTASSNFETAVKAITRINTPVGVPMISRGYSKINLFGVEMVTSCGVASRALGALCAAAIDVVLITTSDLDISLLVREENEDSALLALEKAFPL